MYIVGIWDDVITIKILNRDCDAKKTQHSFNNQPRCIHIVYIVYVYNKYNVHIQMYL